MDSFIWVNLSQMVSRPPLYINGFLNNCNDLLEKHKKYPEFYVAKHKKKVEIAERLIENDIDLSNWHAIEEIENGFKSN